MAVNPNLLAQAIQPQPTAIDAFVPAFQDSQDRIDKRQLAAQENETRLQEMKLKWSEYYQKHQDTQNQAAFQREFAALDPNDPEYGMKVHRLSTRYGVDPKGTSLIPKPEEAPGLEYRDLGDRLGVFQGPELVSEVPKGAAPSGATNVNFMEVFDENGKSVGTWPSGEVPKEYIGNSKYRIMKSAAVTGSAEDVGLEQKGNRDDVRMTVSGFDQTLELLDQTLANISDSKTNTGIPGWTKRNVLDPLVQVVELVFPEKVGRGLYKALDIEGATEIEIAAEFLTGQILPAITNETGGRFTDAERAIARRAIAVLEVNKSVESVRTALQTTRDIVASSRNRLGGLLPQTQGEIPTLTVGDPRFDELEVGDPYIFEGREYRKGNNQ